MFKRILIANRGEIALRVIRACRKMGIESVAVHSEADADSPHLEQADHRVCIGGSKSEQSYLNMTAYLLGFKVEERPYQVGTQKPMPNRMVDSKGTLKAEWLEIMKDYPDRFLVAADQFVGIPGKTRQAPQYMELTWGVVEQLPPEVRSKVARENAIQLYHLD